MIIGIGGVSNSGKSFLAGKIKDRFTNQKVKIICQDDYVFSEEKIPCIRDHIDWEVPQSINFEAFKKAISEAANHCDLIITEGLLVFYRKDIADLFDLKIFLQISKETFLQRKRKDLRWGREPEWYIHYIWSAHEKYGVPDFDDKNLLIVNADKIIDMNKVSDFLETYDT
jgi:uridine kinase